MDGIQITQGTTIEHGSVQVTAATIEAVAVKWKEVVIIASSALIFLV